MPCLLEAIPDTEARPPRQRPERSRRSSPQLDLDLDTDLDDPLWRKVKEPRRAGSVAVHEGIQVLSPDPHAGDLRGEDGLLADEKSGPVGIEAELGRYDIGEGGRDVRFLHEAVLKYDLKEACTKIGNRGPGCLR